MDVGYSQEASPFAPHGIHALCSKGNQKRAYFDISDGTFIRIVPLPESNPGPMIVSIVISAQLRNPALRNKNINTVNFCCDFYALCKFVLPRGFNINIRYFSEFRLNRRYDLVWE